MNNVLMGLFALAVGACFGLVFGDSVWVDKCNQGGIVTRENVVYQCKAVKVEIKGGDNEL